MNTALAALAALVHRESGILVHEQQYPALEAALRRAHPGVDAPRFLELVASPAAEPGLVARLLDETTIKETFFLRDAQQLQRIDWPALVQQARAEGAGHVRVWSTACATGEEPYSLAMLACEALGMTRPPVRIIATDISGDALARARAGRYGTRSVRHIAPDHRGRYFHEQSESLVVGPVLRALVTFAPHNLVLDSTPPAGGPFHLIVCRNVLIYFDTETVERVVGSFGRVLAPSGTVVLGVADALCGSAARLRAIGSAPSADPTAASQTGRTLRRPLGRAPLAVEPEPAPGDATACLFEGVTKLESGDAPAAVVLLRRALYLEPRLGLAAFQLGRAYELSGDPNAAERAYRQALRMIERGELAEHHGSLLGQVAIGDIAGAARARLGALGVRRAAGF